MTENVNKVLGCLTEKRLADMQNGAVSHGWMTIRDIVAQCGFEKKWHGGRMRNYSYEKGSR